MKRFKQFLKSKDLTEAGFVHAVHLEDLILDAGTQGTRSAINTLRHFRDLYSGNSNKKDVGVTLKFDGAPSVTWGTNPENGQFFVATKGLFNKNPKIFYTVDEIKQAESGGKAEKLIDALTYLKDITPKGRIFIGDFMFSKNDLKIKTINNKSHVTMHPNTIVYSAETDSKLGKDILSSKIGIAVHTEYKGNTISSLQANFGVSSDDFKKSKDVWLIDANYPSYEGTANLTKEETKQLDIILSNAGKLFKSTSSETFKLLSTDKELNMLVNTFNNSLIRKGEQPNPNKQAQQLIDWLNDKMNKEIDKRKTETAKNAQKEKFNIILSKIDKKELTNIFKLQAEIAKGKHLILDKLNSLDSLQTFLLTSKGYQTTNHEGFVGVSGDFAGVKLVDRLGFSKANFDKEFYKGWDSAARG